MNNKKSSRVTPSLQSSPYRLRRTSLLILGLGVSAFAPPTWAAACTAGDTLACTAAGGINGVGRGGNGGAGNGQGGGSSVVSPFIANKPGALSAAGQGGDGATEALNGGAGGGGGTVGGGTGGTGQPGTPTFGGGGGGGGDGVYLAAPPRFFTSAVISGGQGGVGGDTPNSVGVGGGGGGGGAGITLGGTATSADNSGQITGGHGGVGGNVTVAGGSVGGGGGGGDGVFLLGNAATLVNEAGSTITGGIGGSAGTGGIAATDGASGAGVNMANDGGTLQNSGTITGGASSGPTGTAGAAVVIYGDSNTITNAGSLAGGMRADGSLAPAIDIKGNGNVVALNDGSSITGDLSSTGTNTSLQLNAATGSLANTITGFSVIAEVVGGASWSLSGAQVLTQNLVVGTNDAAGQILISGAISGANRLTMNGPGLLKLTGNNTYSGGTTLANGTLAIGGAGTLGTGAVTMGAGTTLDISLTSIGVSLASITNSGPGASIKLGGSNLSLSSASNYTFGGVIADGGISGTTGGNVTINGAGGAVTFTSANTYTGGTTLSDGTLNLAGAGSLDANSSVTVNGAGRFDISGITSTGTSIGNLSGNGTVNVGNKLLTINGVSNTVMDGVISGPTGGIIKSGAGALVLNGANTYTGSTSLLGGSLYIGNAPGAALITSDVTTAGGTTLGGYGQISGSVNVAALGHLAPGSIGGMGTLSVGNLTMASGSTLEFDAGAPGSPGNSGLSDHVAVDGNLTLQGVTLNVNDVGSFGPGVYNVFSYTGALDDGDDDGLVLGSIPASSSDLIIQNLTAQKQINLVNATGTTLSFWNGNNLAGPGQMGGGDGTWSTTSVNWTDSAGSIKGAMQPQPGFAIFGGAAGSVTVDDTSGAVAATGIQFDSDGYTLKGGTLTLVADVDHPAPVEVRVGDGSAASMGWTATINNVIAGSDGLAKTGAGTLVLTGANTYTGGTFIQAGELSVDSDAELGDASNSVTLDGGLLRVTGTSFTHTVRALSLGGNGGGLDIADAANTFTLDQAVSGTGGLNKLGVGTLLMTADNAYTGATTISAGTLQLGNGGNTGSVSGDIVDNGTLVFDRSDGVIFSGALSGAGNMLQAGKGSLNLTGDSSAFTGAGNVAAGTLIVDGKLGGTLSIASGATLAGTGTVGSTTLAGGSILAPGNASSPIGTLTVNGNLSFAPGTTYQVQADPAGVSSDLVHVTGTAALAGSVIHIGPDGNFAPSQTYTILTADGGVTGAFDSVASNFAFLAPTLTYDPNDAFLTLKRNSTSFASLAQTRNQRAVAGALDSMAASAALPTAVSTVAAAQAPGTFDALSGEIHPSTTSVLQSIAQAIASMPLDHLRNSLSAGSANGPATAQLGAGDSSALPGSAAQPVWAQVFGNWRTLGGNGNTSQVEESDGGLFVGADRGVGAGWRLGGALGYTGSHSSLNDRNSTSNVDSYSASIFGGKAFQAGPGKINLMLGTAYTWNDIHTKRDVGVAGLDQTLKANYGASTGQVFGELGYALPMNENFTLEPFAGAAYSDLRTRGFSESGESGDSAALNGKSNTNDVTTTTLGLHARTAFAIQETQGHLNATVGWRHAFGDVKPETTMAFDGGQAFTVAGAPLARDAAVLQLGADVAVTKNTTVGVAYSGQYGGGSQQNSGSVNVSWRF